MGGEGLACVVGRRFLLVLIGRQGSYVDRPNRRRCPRRRMRANACGWTLVVMLAAGGLVGPERSVRCLLCVAGSDGVAGSDPRSKVVRQHHQSLPRQRCEASRAGQGPPRSHASPSAPGAGSLANVWRTRELKGMSA